MAAKKSGSQAGSRHGKMPEGWRQQSLQIPDEFHEAFRGEAARWGQSSVKILGTVAVGLLMGMPEDARREFYFWMLRILHDPDQSLSARAVFEKLLDLLAIDRYVYRTEDADRSPSDSQNGWEVTKVYGLPSATDRFWNKVLEDDE